MTILITAFDAFGGQSRNASQEVLEALPESLGGERLAKRRLPTVFAEAGTLARQAMLRLRPDAVVCLGQAGGRDAVTPERVAVNVMDAASPDNAGCQPVDEPVIPGGPAAYFSTLPVKAMVRAIREAGVPAQLSNTAGTYVCNSLMYSVLDCASRELPGLACGFVHLPYLAGQGEPSLPKEDLIRAVTAALEVLIR